jgi:hypothetical protein
MEEIPADWITAVPAFIPTRELLSLYPGFVSLYRERYVEFEETWRDTCLLLGQPLARGPKEARVAALLRPIERALGGSIVEEGGRFYLKISGQGSFEMPLVAEGMRKLGMIARLIATGALLESGYLFWDEPEANLNPKLLKSVAEVVVTLAESGVQVFIGTHSLFLLRELQIFMSRPEHSDLEGSVNYVGLHVGSDGVSADASNELSGIGDIASLDESLAQSDRYLEAVSPW